VSELQREKLSEQSDVDKLRGRSITNFFYHITGKLEEKLTAEQAEAYAAAAKYDAAKFELDSLETEIAEKRAELDSLSDCETQYHSAFDEKTKEIKSSQSNLGEKLLSLENSISKEKHVIKETSSAIKAGEAAYSTADKILDILGEAEDLGSYDIFLKSTFLDISKHNKLDDAQEQIEVLQTQLIRFRCELSGVDIDDNIQASTDGYLRFADIFFDDIFSAVSVLNHIKAAEESICEVRRKITATLSPLYNIKNDAEYRLDKLVNERESLVLSIQ
jgi:hypothetical protein